MTAEKLKALADAERADLGHPDNSAANEILNALPQIVAVVEAAEAQNKWLPTSAVSRALFDLNQVLA